MKFKLNYTFAVIFIAVLLLKFLFPDFFLFVYDHIEVLDYIPLFLEQKDTKPAKPQSKLSSKP